MKRIAFAFGLAAALLIPGTALAFHHTDLPSTDCAAAAAGSPSNNNGQAKFGLAHNLSLPLPPAGVAGASGVVPQTGEIGEGGDACANG